MLRDRIDISKWQSQRIEICTCHLNGMNTESEITAKISAGFKLALTHYRDVCQDLDVEKNETLYII